MQELGAENYKIELVEKVEYYDKEQQLITEACHMMKNNSIEAGYNTKFSVSLENLYYNFYIDIVINNKYVNNG
jgi:hypothetical protein